jgi:hypothetical protein
MNDEDLAAHADAILKVARSQGYRECDFTTTALATQA